MVPAFDDASEVATSGHGGRAEEFPSKMTRSSRLRVVSSNPEQLEQFPDNHTRRWTERVVTYSRSTEET